MASLLRTKGRCSVMRLIKPRFNNLASASKTPQTTSIPAAFSFSKPRPDTKGFGSCIAATTRVTPALISASQQGGVLP